MSTIKPLNVNEQIELENWISDLKTVKIPPSKWSRHFSDGLQLVKILHELNPKLVELHNYSPQNSINQKLKNWETLNRRILKKLGHSWDDKAMESLAKAETGVINRVLYEVIRKIKVPRDNLVCSETEDVDILMVTVKKEIDGKIENRPQKMISFVQYEALKKNYDEQQTTVECLHQKVAHLENMLRLRELRIVELEKQNKKPLILPGFPTKLFENFQLDE